MVINGKEVKVPRGYRRQRSFSRPVKARGHVAWSGGYREDVVWLQAKGR